jgi:hypothetical protein
MHWFSESFADDIVRGTVPAIETEGKAEPQRVAQVFN